MLRLFGQFGIIRVLPAGHGLAIEQRNEAIGSGLVLGQGGHQGGAKQRGEKSACCHKGRRVCRALLDCSRRIRSGQ